MNKKVIEVSVKKLSNISSPYKFTWKSRVILANLNKKVIEVSQKKQVIVANLNKKVIEVSQKKLQGS